MRTFPSLKSKVFIVAKLKHTKRQLDVERTGGAVEYSAAVFQKLGGLLLEMQTRLAVIPEAKNAVGGDFLR